MTNLVELVQLVDNAFARRSPELAPWPNPHEERGPLDEEYSRLTNPTRWRILAARAHAWITALAHAGLATTEPVETATAFGEVVGPTLTSVVRLVPTRSGSLPLLVSCTQIGDATDAGVLLGVGTPAFEIALFPHCGYDACDDGSDTDVAALDAAFEAVVTGRFRRLERGDIVALAGLHDADSLSWSSTRGRSDWGAIQAALVNPNGWNELSGPSWLGSGGP